MTIQEHDGDNATELEAKELDAADLEPLGTEEEFAEGVRELVASSAPRVFALVEEYGERVDGWVIFWGMAFDDEERAEVVSADFCSSGLGVRSFGSFSSAERAQQTYSRRRKVRLVWTSTPATRRADQTT